MVQDFWPEGSSVALHAKSKTGKSLITLWIAAKVALGHDPFTGALIRPRRVHYLDDEMTRRDVIERLRDMHFEPAQLKDRLIYSQYSGVRDLDTANGGNDFLDFIRHHGSEAIVLDTFERFIQGKENDNDTYQGYHNHTGVRLKELNIPILRLDHEGHTESSRARGGSAKGDDVDVDWALQTTETGYQFVRKLSRSNEVPEKIHVTMTADPLAFSRADRPGWPAGTADKARELDRLGAPIDVSRRELTIWLKAREVHPGNTKVLSAAMKYRKDPLNQLVKTNEA